MGRKPQAVRYYRCYSVDEYGTRQPLPNGMYLKTLEHTDQEILYCSANSFLGWTSSESNLETLEEYVGYGILREIPVEEAPPDVIDVGWFENEIRLLQTPHPQVQTLSGALNL